MAGGMKRVAAAVAVLVGTVAMSGGAATPVGAWAADHPDAPEVAGPWGESARVLRVDRGGVERPAMEPRGVSLRRLFDGDAQTIGAALAPAFVEAVERMSRYGVAWTTADASEADTLAANRWVHSAADFNGDGRNDVANIAVDPDGGLWLEGRKGTNGDLLFSTQLPDALFVGVIPTRGPLGESAFLVLSEYERAGILGTSGEFVTRIDLVGPTGAVSTRELVGTYGLAGTTWQYRDIHIALDLLDARLAPTLDVLLVSIDADDPLIGSYSESFRTEIYDATTDTLDRTDPDECGCVFPFRGVDFTGDALDDVFVDRYVLDDNGLWEHGGMDALDGFTFGHLWTAEIPGFWYVDDRAGDVDGDGVEEFVMWGYGPLHMVSGVDGAPTWTRATDSFSYPSRFGDVGRDGTTEMGLIEDAWDPETASVTLSFLTLSSATGDVGATRTRMFTLPSSDDPNSYSYLSFQLIDDAGDVDDDGFADVASRVDHVTVTYDDVSGETTVNRRIADRGVFAGASYERLWNGFAFPIGGSVDGDGADMVTSRSFQTESGSWRQRMHVRDGRTGTVLWGRSFGSDAAYEAFSGFAADLTGDGRAEIVGDVYRETEECDELGCDWSYSSTLLVLNSNGNTRWTR